MDITVAICTWNRARLLERTLETMVTSMRVPGRLSWELLVVDNNSTDETGVVVERFRARLPVRGLFEPRQGLAHARNLAVSEAQGEYIVWTDDDVFVQPDWLEHYWQAFRRRSEASIFGGPIEPWFPEPPPPWLREAWPLVHAAYAVLDLGPVERPLEVGRLPYGANMAFRTEALRRFGYDPRLGHSGGCRLGGEETEAMQRMLAEGITGWWVPGARVRHLVPGERQTVDYLRAYYHGRGQRLHLERQAIGSAGQLARWVCRFALGEAACAMRFVGAAPAVWVRGLRAASVARGVLSAQRLGAQRTTLRRRVHDYVPPRARHPAVAAQKRSGS